MQSYFSSITTSRSSAILIRRGSRLAPGSRTPQLDCSFPSLEHLPSPPVTSQNLNLDMSVCKKCRQLDHGQTGLIHHYSKFGELEQSSKSCSICQFLFESLWRYLKLRNTLEEAKKSQPDYSKVMVSNSRENVNFPIRKSASS